MLTHLVRTLCSDDGEAIVRNINGGSPCDDGGCGGSDVSVVEVIVAIVAVM